MFNENEKKTATIMTYGGSYNNSETKEKMQIDYSNKLMTVKIMPVTDDYRGDEKAGGKLTFAINTAAMFLDELEEAKEAFKAGEKFDGMITCGIQTNNAIQVTDGRAIGRPYGVYIVMYLDIQSNKKCENIFVYTVRSGFVIKDYDARTGGGTSVVKPHREIKEIVTNFREFIKASNRAMAHSVKDADKYRTSALANATRIAGNTGTSMYNNNTASKPKQKSGSIFEDEYDYASDISQVLTGDFSSYN